MCSFSSFLFFSFWGITKSSIITYKYSRSTYKTGVMVVAWNKASGALLGTPHQRKDALDCCSPSILWDWRPHSWPCVWTTQGHSSGPPSAGQLLLTVKVSRIQTSPFLTQKEGAVCPRLGTPWCNLAEHPSNSLRCRVGAKLEMHLPSTSCADYMKHMFLIHVYITHPGSVARAMWWPKEPNESFIIFFKQAPLRWLSFGAKKLHSSSPMTSKLDSLNPRASSDLGSETICFDPEGWLRNIRAGTRLQGEWKS